jgi:hypothetical protein
MTLVIMKDRMPEAVKAAEAASKPFFDQAIWSAVPSILWVLAVLVLVYWFQSELKQLFDAFITRLKSGASIKVVGLEIGMNSGLVAAPGNFSNDDRQVATGHGRRNAMGSISEIAE